MRIIAGNLKGRKLQKIRGYKIRPTSDRLRETLFNILSDRIREAVVLELFAGTGALGIEALSRGAKSAVFIDKYKNALLTINKNIKTCKLEHKAKIINWDIAKNLNCLKPYQSCFNLVFMDPPYNQNLVKPALENLHKIGALDLSALIVVEHGLDEAVSENIRDFNLLRQRKYNKTIVSFFEYDLNPKSKE